MSRVIAVSFLAAVLAAPLASANAPQASWTPGPASVDLADDVARIQLQPGHAFAGAADTRRLLQEMGNTVGNTEVGMVTPTEEGQDWLVIFEYEKAGYVKDDDKDEIDKDA